MKLGRSLILLVPQFEHDAQSPFRIRERLRNTANVLDDVAITNPIGRVVGTRISIRRF